MVRIVYVLVMGLLGLEMLVVCELNKANAAVSILAIFAAFGSGMNSRLAIRLAVVKFIL